MSGMRFRTSVAGLAVAVVATGVVVTGASGPAAAVPSAGRTELVSVASDGSQGDESDEGAEADRPVVSGDGRHVAFTTLYPLDPADDDRSWDIYVRSGNRTVRISEPHGDNRNPAISTDGRYVAYDSADESGRRVFVCDRDQDGDDVFDEDRRCIAVGRSEHDNSEPSLSADATRMVWNEQPREWGTPRAVTARLTKDADGRLTAPESFVDLLPTDPGSTEVRGAEGPPRISTNGRHVVLPVLLCEYYCTALRGRRLLTLNGRAQPSYRHAVFAADLDTLRMTRLDVLADGTPVGDDATLPVVSGNGRMVAFASMDWSVEFNDVVVLDRDTDGDGVLGTGEPVSYTEIGEGTEPALSADGRYLAFHTSARDLHNGLDGPTSDQVVVRDLRLPLSVRGELASPGLGRDCVPDPGPEVCAGNDDSHSPSLSADGSVVAYASEADDLVTEDENGTDDVFTRTFRPTVVAEAADFGTVSPGGTVERVITVRHKGFGPLRVAGPEVTGPQAGDFAVFPTDTCLGAVLHATESCVVSIRFRPAGTGRRAATLRVAAGNQVVSVPLTGSADGPPSFDLAVSPPELAFPGERPALSVSLPEVVTVTNTGTSPLVVRSVAGVDGPALHARDYLIAATDCPGATLAPGQSCTVTVRNLPHGAGERPGALLLVTETFTRVITLRARGTAPTAVVNPGVVVAGRVVEVAGTGFPPERDVTVTLPGNGSTVVARTDQVGAFAVPLQVFDNGLIGSVVTWVTAPDTELLIAAPLLVVPGTYQPPTFIGRR